MKATSFSSSISANLGNSGEAMAENSQVFGQKKFMDHTFVLFVS